MKRIVIASLILFLHTTYIMALSLGSDSNDQAGRQRAPENSRATPIKEKVNALVRPYLNSRSFSGAVLVARDGKIVVNKGYGMASYEYNVPVTTQTKFYVASISKSFTAAAVLLLQEKGLLNVNDPISRFIPDFPNGERITIHQLLTHTSGITNYITFPDFADLSKRFYTVEQVTDLFRNKPLIFQPGQRSSYSNSNYALLAYIIEKVSGLKYGEFLRTSFFDPLGMSDTGHPGYPNEIITHLASAYSPVGFREFETARYMDRSILIGAGSLYSTTTDLFKWIQGLAAGRVLKKNSLEQMFKDHTSGGRGYGWIIRNLWNRKVTAGNGWDGVGFAGDLMYFSSEGLTVIVLGNVNISSVTGEIAAGVSAIALREKSDTLKIDPAPISGQFAHRLTGKYKLGDDFFVPGTILDIVEKNGSLFEQQRNPDRLIGLIRISDLEFIHRSSWGRIKFKVDKKGETTGMLFYGRFEAAKLTEN